MSKLKTSVPLASENGGTSFNSVNFRPKKLGIDDLLKKFESTKSRKGSLRDIDTVHGLKLTREVWDEIKGIPPYNPRIEGLIPTFKKVPGYEEIERYWVDEPYVFVVIMRSTETGELLYNVCEPLLTETEKTMLESIIRGLRGKLSHIGTIQDREEVLTKKVVEDLKSYGASISPKSARKILYYARRNCLGNREIDPIMKDGNIEDISCNGPNIPIFLYHKKYRNIPTNVAFADHKRLDSFVISMAEFSGKSISYGAPTLDATLPGGSRLQATLGTEVTTHGSSFTIRKFSEQPFTPTLLIKYGTYSSELLAYLWLVGESTKSIMIVGGTASGKTSTLNALALFLPPKAKIVTIEETREIALYQENWVPSVTRESVESHERSIELFDLVKQALRQRPECIIVGEIRGREGLPVFQAMSTGHSCYSTMHATTVQEAVNRLESEPINVPHTMMDSLDVMCFQAMVRRGDERMRRVQNVTEFLGLDPATGDVQINKVYEWDAESDTIKKTAGSVIMREIMESRGWDLMKLYQEMENRRLALEYLVENNVIEHADFSDFMNKYYADPEATIEKIKSRKFKPRILT